MQHLLCLASAFELSTQRRRCCARGSSSLLRRLVHNMPEPCSTGLGSICWLQQLAFAPWDFSPLDYWPTIACSSLKCRCGKSFAETSAEPLAVNPLDSLCPLHCSHWSVPYISVP